MCAYNQVYIVYIQGGQLFTHKEAALYCSWVGSNGCYNCVRLVIAVPTVSGQQLVTANTINKVFFTFSLFFAGASSSSSPSIISLNHNNNNIYIYIYTLTVANCIVSVLAEYVIIFFKKNNNCFKQLQFNFNFTIAARNVFSLKLFLRRPKTVLHVTCN